MTLATPPTLLPLRDYQQSARDAFMDAVAAGNTRQMIVLPTGAGKTLLATHLVNDLARPRQWRTVFVVHRDELVKQSVRSLGNIDPTLSVGICKAEQSETHAPIIVASAQTLAQRRRLDRLKAALADAPGVFWIEDECFPAGTLVGDVPIERLKVGDSVPAYDETTGLRVRGRVTALFQRAAPSYFIRITAGSHVITCTPEHPILTGIGWRPARVIEEGWSVFADPNVPTDGTAMQRMSAGVRDNQEGAARRASTHRPGLLLKRVLGCFSIPSFQPRRRGHKQDSRKRPHESAEPNGRDRSTGTDGGHIAGAWTPSYSPWWQRTRADSTATVNRGRSWLANGSGRQDWLAAPQPGRVIGSLQDRRGRTDTQDRPRSGRQDAPGKGGGARPQENQLLRAVRVDRVEIVKRGDPDGPSRLCPDGLVYNIEVERYHTYIAGGIVVHNCHHSIAPTRQRAIREVAPDVLLGLTATPERGDGGALGNLFDGGITYQVGMLELMARGRLARLVGVRVGTDVSLDAVRTTAGELNEGDLEDAVDTPRRNQLIVDAWHRHAADRKRTVVFCVTVAHAVHVAEAFQAAGIETAAVFGEASYRFPAGRTTRIESEREPIYAAFHRGDVRVLVNVMVCTEGWDEPAIDAVVMARPTKSRGLFVQCVGRGARTAPGKADCLVLDMVDVSSRHKLVGMASLTTERANLSATDDEDEDAPATDEPFDLLELAAEQEARRQERAERQARLNLEADAGRARLATETKAVNLYAASPWLWQESKGIHYAPAGEGTWLVIKAHPDGFRPYLLRSDRTTRDATLTELFDRSLDFEMAMGLAHDRAPQLPPKERRLYDRAATWRTQLSPPSEAQLAAAARWRIPLTGNETKAEVSRLMDEAVFNAAHWRATRGRNR